MAVQTTANLTNSIAALYRKRYIDGISQVRLYDQIAVPYNQVGADGKTMDELMQSSSINIPFLSEMTPGTAAISQTADLTPQTLTDTTLNATWSSRGEALQWSQQLAIEAYTDYTAKAYERIGQNMAESVESVCINAALAGSLYSRYTATRVLMDAGTSTHRASDSIFRQMAGVFLSLRAPGFINDDGSSNTFMAIMHPYPYHDICESGNVDVIGQYQDKGIHLNWELGNIGNFRLVVSPYAKVFMGAGIPNATDVSDTLDGAVTPLATTLATHNDNAANVNTGLFWNVGTTETGNTFYPTNEQIRPISASTVTVTFSGSGPNGGLRFAHADHIEVNNSDSVYSILFAGPQSLVKVFATDVGEFGEVVGPKKSGLADQFTSLAWKWYGGYNRWGETRLYRYEVSTSYEG